jgi:hypothetical protein
MQPATTRLLAIFCFFCLLGTLSCEKDTPKSDTIVRGRVLDAETLLPLEGVTINYLKTTGYGKKSFSSIQDEYWIQTDTNGRFEFNLGPLGGRVQSIFKFPVYLPYNPINMPASATIQFHVVNEWELLMRPQNSLLKVIVRNKHGLKDKVYVGVTDDIYESEYRKGDFRTLNKYPLIQSTGSDFIDSFYVFSDIQTKIKWRFETGASIPYLTDSLVIAKNATATYVIEY